MQVNDIGRKLCLEDGMTVGVSPVLVVKKSPQTSGNEISARSLQAVVNAIEKMCSGSIDSIVVRSVGVNIKSIQKAMKVVDVLIFKVRSTAMSDLVEGGVGNMTVDGYAKALAGIMGGKGCGVWLIETMEGVYVRVENCAN